MAEITSDKTKQLVIYPKSRNNKIFWTSIYIKQGTLTKDKERKKEKGRSFSVTNRYPERDMVFPVRPDAVTCNEAVQQKKKVVIISDSMPKSIKLSAIK